MKKRKLSQAERRERLQELRTAIKNHLEDYEHHFDLWVGQRGCWISVSDAKLMHVFVRTMNVAEAARCSRLTRESARQRLVELVTVMRKNRLNYLQWLIEVVRKENKQLASRPAPPVRRIESNESFVPGDAFFKRPVSGMEEGSVNLLRLRRDNQSLFAHDFEEFASEKSFELPEKRKAKGKIVGTENTGAGRMS